MPPGIREKLNFNLTPFTEIIYGYPDNLLCKHFLMSLISKATLKISGTDKLSTLYIFFADKCGTLRDLVPFVQLKKREKHP